MILHRQRGFSAIEGLLLLVIAGLLGFVGWYVWNSQKVANKSYNNASNATSTATQKRQYTAEDKYIPLDGGGRGVNFGLLAQTDEQKAINEGLKRYCASLLKQFAENLRSKELIDGSIFVVGDVEDFFKSDNFTQEGNWVKLNGSCVLTPVETLQGGGGYYILKKTKSGLWEGVVSGNGGEACADVDGMDMPKSMLEQCYESGVGNREIRP